MKARIFAGKKEVLAMLAFRLEEAQKVLVADEAELAKLESSPLYVDNYEKGNLLVRITAAQRAVDDITDKISLIESDESQTVDLEIDL